MVINGKIIMFVLFFVTLILLFSSLYAQTISPQTTLNQYISDLQKNPNDYALREKIIRHVQGMRPAPAIPEEARRHYVKACTLFEDAKQPSDSADAAEEFRQALLVAPWWGEAYMKMGLALETAQRYDDAIASLKLFMATKPQDEVLRKAQDEIYKIEAKAQKAAKDAEAKAKEKKLAAREKAEREAAALKREVDLSGTWEQSPSVTCWQFKFAVNRKQVVITSFCPGSEEELVGVATLTDHTFEGTVNTSPDKVGGTRCPGKITGVISEDNSTIKISLPSCRGGFYGHTLIRKAR